MKLKSRLGLKPVIGWVFCVVVCACFPRVFAADPDVVPPVLNRAANLGANEIRLYFSEPLATGPATTAANYTVNGGIQVTGASFLGTNSQIVLLAVSTLSFGQTYQITARSVSDLAEPPNLIGAGGVAAFRAMEFLPEGVGIASGPTVRISADTFTLTGGGADLGGTGDQFQFAWQNRSGNFDVQVRVATVTASSPFVHAGLMARTATDTNAPFAGVFASSPQLGCFFETRATPGVRSAVLSPPGDFPPNYPWTYLRLRRAGNQYTGFGSHNGEAWIQLGTAEITMPASIQLGLVVCSQNPNETATAEFLEFGPTKNSSAGTYRPEREPLGPSSRRTGLVFSEIHYHPAPVPGNTNSLEFIEIYNTGPVFEDLTGWRLSGAVDYKFPAGTKIPAAGFLVIAENPEAVRKAYGISGVLGPYEGELNNDGELLRLRDHVDAIRLELTFGANPPWPEAADGAGHSLVLARPSYGEDDPRAWAASERVGGTPGAMEAVRAKPYRSVFINEFLAHTDDPQLDFVELYNRGNTPVDLSGCILTDDPSTNRFVLPPGTTLSARGFLAWDQNQLGFRLNAAGETLYLFDPRKEQVIDAVRFGGQENGVSSGRSPDGASTMRRLSLVTPGAANAPWRQEDIVLNEIMYHPISGDRADEYLEFFNRGTTVVDLSGWRLTRGVGFEIPAGIRLSPGQYLVVAKDAARLRSKHPHLTPANSVGDFSGSLSDSRDHVALAKPIVIVSTNAIGALVTNVAFATVAETAYYGGGRWGYYSDGGGSSLELTDPDADPLRASNWADSDETQKSKWELVEFTGPLDNGASSHAPNRFRISMLGAGECLIDNVEIFKVGSTNLIVNTGFESGQTGWSISGNHSLSSVRSTGAFEGSQCLHVIAQGDGDTGVNAIRVNIVSGAAGIASGNTATIRARVRWLAGWPEVLFRTRGSYIELPARMTVPEALGTPGRPNSKLVANAGPAIFDVTHTPALPRANQPVLVTCRVSDPDGFGALSLRFRVEPTLTYGPDISMRDDGFNGDEVAGDGVYSAQISGRSAGTLVGFVIIAQDGAADRASSTFPVPGGILPVSLPSREGLIRWDDPLPSGTFGHYHLWNTQLTQSRRNNALDNTFRDCTLIYGNHRVIYNAGFRDKGSPFHGGGGDYAVTVPRDEMLLGVADRVFGSTGNGGSEESGVRSRISAWIGQKLGIPYLHAHFVRVYRNGQQHQNISEDLEQPNHYYAESQFPGLGGEGDLHKISIWFEFQDDNRAFDATQATLDRFNSGGSLKRGRYRWNWQRRPRDGTANNLTNVFELVAAANATTDYTARMLQLADMEEWMRVFAFHRILGNWDSWNFNVGQNMYAYKVPGERWKLIPWDIDFVLGLGNPPTDPPGAGTLGGSSQDPIATRFFNDNAFRRALWRAHFDAVTGPLLVENYSPQIAFRRNALIQNGITGLGPTNAIYSYINSRRNYLVTQIGRNDTNVLAITSNNGADVTTSSPTVTVTGMAPFNAATLEVNGIPYPVTWTSPRNFSMVIPLTQANNRLAISGVDGRGVPLTNAPAVVNVTYTGTVLNPAGQVVIHEIQYNPNRPNASFIELYNASSTTPFDLSGYRLEGAGYTFPEGAIVPRNGYMLLVSNRRGFATAYGNTIPVFDEFPGNLDNGGEHLRLVKPGAGGSGTLISDVRYDDEGSWPKTPDGGGPSLQLIDASLGAYRVGNWTAAATNDSILATPGRANSLSFGLPLFPEVWLNEVLPSNVAGPTDNAGERESFVELYNAGTETVDLTGLFLAPDYTNLTQWPFPNGTTIAPKGFLVVWLDGQTQQSTAAALHANFRVGPTNGSVALVRRQGPGLTPAVIDYIDYRQLTPGRSFGSFPDGEPRDRRAFSAVTLGTPNNTAFPSVKLVINEFMASNTNSITDPADGARDDWFELHNGGTTSLDLTSYRLTDEATNVSKFIIPPGYVIPPGGYLLVWADNEPKQNQSTRLDLHVNFRLAQSGGYLGVFGPDDQLVNDLTYGPQTSDVSSGRFPDGSTDGVLPFEIATPRAANFLSGGNRPPNLAAIPAQSGVEMSALVFTAVASDPDAGQTLSFSLGAGAPPGAAIDARTGRFQWIPEENQGPGVYSILVRVSDNGIPARTSVQSVALTVAEANRPPVASPTTLITVDEGQALRVRVQAIDPDLPVNVLRYELVPPTPAGLELDAATGDLAWTPTETDGPGSHVIRVLIRDDGNPPLSTTAQVNITVNEVDNPPLIEAIQAQTVDENTTFRYQVKAADPDDANAALSYALDGNPPPGLSIDANSGLITWTPDETQGPSSHIILVRVTEKTGGSLSSTRSFGLAVNEVNQPAKLAAIGDFNLEEGTRLNFISAATDLDLPPQPLVFSLAAGAPSGASIDSATGAFEWNVPADAGASTNRITIQVTDLPGGGVADSKSFTVTVHPKFKVGFNEVLYRSSLGGEFIELHNASAVTAWDLSGYRLSGRSLNFVFPSGSRLNPGGILSVARDATAFRAAHGTKPLLAGVWTGSLGASEDDLRLMAPGDSGAVLDRVVFRASAPWPAQASNGGTSLQVIDPTQSRARVANWGVAENYTGPRDLIAINGIWKYYQAGPLEASWKNSAFNDGPWPQGRALHYVETAALPAPKSTALTIGQNTYYFRTRFVLPTVPKGASLVLSNIIDDGAVFYLNGVEVHRQGIDPGPVDFNTIGFDFLNPKNAVGDAGWVGPITLPANALVAGTNVFAVEVHQVNATSSDVVFGATLNLVGGSIASVTPGETNSIAASLPAFPEVWINELLPNNTAGITDANGEREPWIELINAGTTVANLEGLFLGSSFDLPSPWAFPPGTTLAPGTTLLVFADGEPAETTPASLHANFRLGLPAGAVVLSRLQSGAQAVLDYLEYAGVPPNSAMASVPDGQGFERKLVSVATPGAANAPGLHGPPVFNPVPTQNAVVGIELVIPLTALDPNPGQTVRFSLDAPAPAGAAIDRDTGRLTWRPTQPGSFTLVARATDNGTPPQSYTLSIVVVVSGSAGPALRATVEPDGSIRLHWTSRAGVSYQVQSKDDLLQAEWRVLSTVTATGETSSIGEGPVRARAQRFYRIVENP